MGRIGKRSGSRSQPWADIPFALSLAEVMKDLVEPAPRFGGNAPNRRPFGPLTDRSTGRPKGRS